MPPSTAFIPPLLPLLPFILLLLFLTGPHSGLPAALTPRTAALSFANPVAAAILPPRPHGGRSLGAAILLYVAGGGAHARTELKLRHTRGERRRAANAHARPADAQHCACASRPKVVRPLLKGGRGEMAAAQAR